MRNMSVNKHSRQWVPMAQAVAKWGLVAWRSTKVGPPGWRDDTELGTAFPSIPPSRIWNDWIPGHFHKSETRRR